MVSLIIPITRKKNITIFAGAAYQEPMRYLVIRKFRQDLLASKYLAKLLCTFVPNTVFDGIDAMVPVPLHWSRYARRGFNQSVEIARELSSLQGVPVKKVLKRIKMTSFQFHLSKELRKDNVKSAFLIRKRKALEVKGKRLLLIDDLCTTGATLVSAAKELYAAGAKEVTALVGCRKL